MSKVNILNFKIRKNHFYLLLWLSCMILSEDSQMIDKLPSDLVMILSPMNASHFNIWVCSFQYSVFVFIIKGLNVFSLTIVSVVRYVCVFTLWHWFQCGCGVMVDIMTFDSLSWSQIYYSDSTCMHIYVVIQKKHD